MFIQLFLLEIILLGWSHLCANLFCTFASRPHKIWFIPVKYLKKKKKRKSSGIAICLWQFENAFSKREPLCFEGIYDTTFIIFINSAKKISVKLPEQFQLIFFAGSEVYLLSFAKTDYKYQPSSFSSSLYCVTHNFWVLCAVVHCTRQGCRKKAYK